MNQDTASATPCHGYAARDAESPLRPHSFTRRALRPDDVRIEIRYCGVCHTDLHQARNDWRNTVYPCVPGHEIVGQVTAVGAEARRYRVGDWVAVGCLVDSCKSCSECTDGREQYCRTGATLTYNGKDRHTGEITFGGYSTDIVVREDFVLRAAAGPRPGARGTTALRRHHDLVAAPALARRPRFEGRRGRPRRARPHGRQARARPGRGSHGRHALAGQGERGALARRAPRADLDRRRGDESGARYVRFRARHDPRRARDRRVPATACGRRARWSSSA